MTKAEPTEARNLSLGQLMILLMEIQNGSLLPSEAIVREIQNRLVIASNIAVRLEDSLFYARMYHDRCQEGKARREEMIDDAVDLISVFRNGGIYP